MSSRSPWTSTIALAAATPLAVVVAGGLIWQASYSAFSGQTRDSGNAWLTGAVAITDDDRGTARFQMHDMVPGDKGTSCIAVTAESSAPGEVRAYAINAINTAQPLAERLLISVERGTGGGSRSCAGFSADPSATTPAPRSLRQVATQHSWTRSLGGWPVDAGSTTHTYRITWEFDTTGMDQEAINALQGETVGLDVQWELQTA
jgi:hypothetical protein